MGIRDSKMNCIIRESPEITQMEHGLPLQCTELRVARDHKLVFHVHSRATAGESRSPVLTTDRSSVLWVQDCFLSVDSYSH